MTAGVGIAANLVLAIIKIAAGLVGNSYALVADGIESMTDVVSSLVVWTGLKVSALPADEDHPYGHGKAEPIAGVVVALALLGAALLFAVQSVREIITPHHAPAWFTLVVLAVVVVYNASCIARAALGAIMDQAAPGQVQQEIRALAASVPGGVRVEKCHTRKSGLGLIVEIHLEVDGELSVRRGHDIGHAVVNRLKASHLSIQHVVAHVEPAAPWTGT
jgi:divalent metal cation (Fe/Co/Zn/Cd) transporter